MKKFNNPTIKAALTSITFYVVAIAFIYFGDKESPGGPCAPGMGILFSLLLIPTSLALFIKNAVLAIKGNTIKYASLLVHFSALVVSITCFFN